METFNLMTTSSSLKWLVQVSSVVQVLGSLGEQFRILLDSRRSMLQFFSSSLFFPLQLPISPTLRFSIKFGLDLPLQWKEVIFPYFPPLQLTYTELSKILDLSLYFLDLDQRSTPFFLSEQLSPHSSVWS